MPLQDIREQIDALDGELLDLISKRIDLAREISELKKLEGRDIVDPEREKQLLIRLKEKAISLHLPPEHIEHIWQKIIELSRFVQK